MYPDPNRTIGVYIIDFHGMTQQQVFERAKVGLSLKERNGLRMVLAEMYQVHGAFGTMIREYESESGLFQWKGQIVYGRN